jgi:hypothetical protein
MDPHSRRTGGEALAAESGLRDFSIAVGANAAYAILMLILKGLDTRFASGRPTHRRWTITIVIAIWFVSNGAYAYFSSLSRQGYVFLALSTMILLWFVLRDVVQFRRIGLIGADVSISNGINSAKALDLVSSSLDFLGIGASKLTQETENFQGAVDRCDRAGRPIRFLLSSPGSTDLKRIAQKAGVNNNAYKQKVTESLRIIANLKIQRAKNIEVRFYDEIPAFRLMFIDDELCLASHYILGKGDGSQLPQLHVVRQIASQDVNSLYFGFHEYFENIWENSKEWDFKRYLE